MNKFEQVTSNHQQMSLTGWGPGSDGRGECAGVSRSDFWGWGTLLMIIPHEHITSPKNVTAVEARFSVTRGNFSINYEIFNRTTPLI